MEYSPESEKMPVDDERRIKDKVSKKCQRSRNLGLINLLFSFRT